MHLLGSDLPWRCIIMKQFRSLIVVVAGKDGGQLAVDQAATLAAQNSGTITLVDAIMALPMTSTPPRVFCLHTVSTWMFTMPPKKSLFSQSPRLPVNIHDCD
jgi:nucleotide-binding universal stress UspA family protein